MVAKPLCSGICTYFDFSSANNNKPPTMTQFQMNTKVTAIDGWSGVFACLSGVDSAAIRYVAGLKIKPSSYWSDF